MPRAIVLHAKDNVATLLDNASAGDCIDLFGESQGRVTLRAAIDFGHKVAIAPVAVGAALMKYGVVIGLSTREIAVGEYVHVHNVEALRARGDRETA